MTSKAPEHAATVDSATGEVTLNPKHPDYEQNKKDFADALAAGAAEHAGIDPNAATAGSTDSTDGPQMPPRLVELINAIGTLGNYASNLRQQESELVLTVNIPPHLADQFLQMYEAHNAKGRKKGRVQFQHWLRFCHYCTLLDGMPIEQADKVFTSHEHAIGGKDDDSRYMQAKFYVRPDTDTDTDTDSADSASAP